MWVPLQRTNSPAPHSSHVCHWPDPLAPCICWPWPRAGPGPGPGHVLAQTLALALCWPWPWPRAGPGPGPVLAPSWPCADTGPMLAPCWPCPTLAPCWPHAEQWPHADLGMTSARDQAVSTQGPSSPGRKGLGPLSEAGSASGVLPRCPGKPRPLLKA